MATIYMSCSFKDYDNNNQFERYIIEKLFPNQEITIINPKNIKIAKEDVIKNLNTIAFNKHQMRIMEKYFFPLIKQSNYLIAFANNGKLTSCMKQEIRYAKYNHIQTQIINITLGV